MEEGSRGNDRDEVGVSGGGDRSLDGVPETGVTRETDLATRVDVSGRTPRLGGTKGVSEVYRRKVRS